ncbi:uncharacterized protein V6R79_008790 [Siganus canaliculatus]
MKSFILVAVLLQLAAIITPTTAYEFGDIIAFPWKCPKTDKMSYIHYGVYVGGKDAPKVGQKNDDVFFLSPKLNKKMQEKCKFGKIRKVRNNMREVVFNDLDSTEGVTVKSPEEMAEQILDLMGKCGKQDITLHNSEHVATLVRYGERISLQLGGKLERLGKERADLPPEIRQKLESIECERIRK